MLCDHEWEGRESRGGSCWVWLLMPRSMEGGRGWEHQSWEPLLCQLECLAATQHIHIFFFKLCPCQVSYRLPLLENKSEGSFLTPFLGLLRRWITTWDVCAASGKCTNALCPFVLISALWPLGLEWAKPLPLLNPQITPFYLVWLEREGRRNSGAHRMSCQPCSCCSPTCSKIAQVQQPQCH